MKTFRFLCGHNKNKNADTRQPELNRQEEEDPVGSHYYSNSYFHCRSRQDHNPGIILTGKYRPGGSTACLFPA